mmetsp:Transcript_12587/g.45935  ORF Transcript_12587/g.45935 Transcript_12587/m.45935 type:complete len:726 (+) Transcript_12587:227-2404(+)
MASNALCHRATRRTLPTGEAGSTAAPAPPEEKSFQGRRLPAYRYCQNARHFRHKRSKLQGKSRKALLPWQAATFLTLYVGYRFLVVPLLVGPSSVAEELGTATGFAAPRRLGSFSPAPGEDSTLDSHNVYGATPSWGALGSSRLSGSISTFNSGGARELQATSAPVPMPMPVPEDLSGCEEGDSTSLLQAIFGPYPQPIDENGGVALYLAIMLYMFVGIAVICDDYFVPALEMISETLQLSEDVAGATFMAAGSSAPELAVAIITILIQPGDAGLGTIVGSAVFNICTIVGLTAIVAGQALLLQIYPLARDSLFYVASLVMLVAFMIDGAVSWWEGLLLTIGYVVYVTYMYFDRNREIHDWLMLRFASWCSCCRRKQKTDDDPVSAADNDAVGLRANDALAKGSNADSGSISTDTTKPAQGTVIGSKVNVIELASVTPASEAKDTPTPNGGAEGKELAINSEKSSLKRRNFHSVALAAVVVVHLTGKDVEAGGLQVAVAPPADIVETNGKKIEDSDEAKDDDDDDDEEEGYLFWRILVFPWRLAFDYTIPYPGPGWEMKWKWAFMVGFFMCIIWIGLTSYIMVDTATRAGCVIGIPDVVIGIVILSAGTSVPDAVSSVLVAREGKGDMAVANVLGSNVFNIFLGLGLPWFINGLINSEGTSVPKDEIVEPIVILLVYVIAFILTLVANSWYLTWKTGVALIIQQLLYTIWTLLRSLPEDNPVIDF